VDVVKHVSEARLRAEGATLESIFSTRVCETLTLEDLSALFRDTASMLGACQHRCVAVEGGEKVFLFGDDHLDWDTRDSAVGALTFPITGWDERDYEVEFAVLPGFDVTHSRASLHLLASLYVCRGLALLDAGDDLADTDLTAIERRCIEARQEGLCDLDIAEDLDRTVHAIGVHVQRANRKLGH
jgi:hypothetical protein